jgi:hypothetical protein
MWISTMRLTVPVLVFSGAFSGRAVEREQLSVATTAAEPVEKTGSGGTTYC